jgi:hypothetical protein
VGRDLTSARLLFGLARRQRRRDGQGAEDHRELGGVDAVAGVLPVLGCESEDARGRPAGENAEEVSQGTARS